MEQTVPAAVLEQSPLGTRSMGMDEGLVVGQDDHSGLSNLKDSVIYWEKTSLMAMMGAVSNSHGTESCLESPRGVIQIQWELIILART